MGTKCRDRQLQSNPLKNARLILPRVPQGRQLKASYF
jgi:hypothetical protein